jgi:hypothetical protein
MLTLLLVATLIPSDPPSVRAPMLSHEYREPRPVEGYLLEMAKDWRAPATPEERFLAVDRRGSARPARRLSRGEAEELAKRLPPPHMIPASQPWIGRARWVKGAVATEAELRQFMRGTDEGLRWAAISEAAVRRLPNLAPELERLAREGWAPAAYGLSRVRADDRSTARDLLRSDQPGVRRWAAKTLAEAGDRRGRDALWEALRTEPRRWRVEAGPYQVEEAMALLPFERDDPRRLDELIGLSRTHRFVQFVAALDTPASRTVLIRRAREDSYHLNRQWATMALATRPDAERTLARVVSAEGPGKAFAEDARGRLARGERPFVNMSNYGWGSAGE